ncbi:MAG: hypothetical protein FJ272_05800, partial [Planctomycetes bacterium]|nr:hypothetical protein [Planctomycetota bacterium]
MSPACLLAVLVSFAFLVAAWADEPAPRLSQFTVELPNLQCPISLIIDDPTPIFADRLSAEDLARRKAEGKGVDMRTFFDDLVGLFQEYGVKGKFTVNSYVSSVGMIDRLSDPNRKRQLDEFVSVVKTKLMPNFDITPEIISHGVVLNVETDQPLGVQDPENVWSQTQDEDTLERYIGRGLTALKNVGLECNGVTSPSDFGQRNEANYVRAISRALKRVNGVKLAWYFLQSDSADYIEPRLMLFDRRNGEVVVNIMPTSRISDIGLSKRFERDIAKTVDEHITADGKGGVIPQMVASRSYLVFYKHWGLLYDGGQETGVKVLREVLDRVRRFYAADVRWMTCSDIARYYAVAKTYRLTQRSGKDSVSLTLESPYACPGFTVGFCANREVKRVSA